MYGSGDVGSTACSVKRIHSCKQEALKPLDMCSGAIKISLKQVMVAGAIPLHKGTHIFYCSENRQWSCIVEVLL